MSCFFTSWSNEATVLIIYNFKFCLYPIWPELKHFVIPFAFISLLYSFSCTCCSFIWLFCLLFTFFAWLAVSLVSTFYQLMFCWFSFELERKRFPVWCGFQSIFYCHFKQPLRVRKEVGKPHVRDKIRFQASRIATWALSRKSTKRKKTLAEIHKSL